ncbi:hypothetical protein [Clostridium perfringens]|uniref:hypothetical protein n=1 Tax=Clostridium perfringens TaxID=1502 RepID=UPI000D71630F|nr:hypothetical protein [Clostridium perfringens]EIF6153552.1 hypothetical protein [Clostridium perfringens]ELC8353313.1 hypothetical protein [Clostridium perfringens]MCX0383235.1 hypothetical protein [Clostridium perfringens]PWX20775.1 hypothetical protein CYK64_08710 [Clostridium perfringens]TPG01496.1 hypothetical protein CBI46_04570 [Clostridium perfringens A]
MMKKQIKLYSVKLYGAKTDDEKNLTKLKKYYERKRYLIRKGISDRIKFELGLKKDEWNSDCKELFKKRASNHRMLKITEATIKNLDKGLKGYILNFGKEKVREIKKEDLRDKDIIAIFENTLTRTLNMNDDKVTLDFITIDANKEDHSLLEQVIKNGIVIENEKYKFFTAGAGQTRQKKFLMIKESIWKDNEQKLMCGLTIDKINKKGGMNINKFLAYLSLNNSASDVWGDFNIDKCIVVDDMELNVKGEVDYLTRDDKVFDRYITDKNGKQRRKYKVDWNIERKIMDVPIPVMDGCGICMPKISNKKNIQIRLPWIKGLLSPTNFHKFAKLHNSTRVTDIYGKEYDVIKDDIQIIFTKSQFKMWKYYDSWEEYKKYFKDLKCIAAICKEDLDKFKNKNINYQKLQTLTEMSDDDIKKLTFNVKDTINKVHYDRDAQLEFLGATLDNDNRDNLQEILRLYPELLSSAYIKKQLKDSIDKVKKDAKSGRIKINAKRTFLIPDLVAFMEWLFLGEKEPKGALKDGEVYCTLYNKDSRLGVLRDPHLSREWAIRKNVANKKNEYFITKGIYTSSNDLISKILMFDNDGDEAFVVSDEEKWLLDLAEKQMKDIRPLYYEMGKAGAKEINLNNIYSSLKFAYDKGNIGKVSNTLTDIWNRENPEQYDKLIKWLTAYNNFIIDAAKTLQVPKAPTELNEVMKNREYPYFFQFAKGGKDKKVKNNKFNKKKVKKVKTIKAKDCRPISNSTMDRICKSIDNIPYTNFDYSKGFAPFRVSKLCNNSRIDISENVIEFYKKLEEETLKRISDYNKNDNKEQAEILSYGYAKDEVKKYCIENNLNKSDVIDMIVKWSFKNAESRLAFIFQTFGQTIIENLKNNLKNNSIDDGYILCKDCGKRIKKTNNRMVRCVECAKKENINKTKNRNKSA